MKLRNVVIVLLAIFMVFAFASCSNEPKNNPQPGPTGVNQTYRLTATKSRVDKWYTDDKFALDFTLLDGFSVKENDVISFSYRSTMEFEEYSIRHGDFCWVYEDSKDALTSYEVGDDGWIKVSYKFGNKCFKKDNQVSRSDWELEPVPYPETFRFDLRGYVFAGDILEIKDLALNGNYLTLTQNLIASDYCEPTLVVVNENTPAFPGARDFAVIYGEGSLSNNNAPLSYEMVKDGGKVAHVPTRDHYTISLYTTSDPDKQNEETLFNPEEATITKDTVVYIKAIPNQYSVTFDYNNGDQNEVVQVPYGSVATPSVATPSSGNDSTMFVGWFTGEDYNDRFDLSTPISGEMTLKAKYATKRTVTFVTDCDTPYGPIILAEGNPVDLPELTKANHIFAGWFTDLTDEDTEYVKGTPVESDMTLYALWKETVKVTLNLNHPGENKTEDVIAIKGDKMDAPEVILPGFLFDGWYDDAELQQKHDFTVAVNAAFPLYAKWKAGTIYQLVSTHDTEESIYDFDKFTIQYNGSGDKKVNAGDVLSFRFRTTTEFTFFSIRGDQKWVYENNSSTRGMTTYETKDDGWTYVTYEFAANDTSNAAIPANAWWRFDFGSRTIVVGDILEVQGFALNGEPLTIAAENLTKYVQPTVEVIPEEYEWDRTASFTVSFETGDASSVESETVAFGQRAIKPEDPEKEGFALRGWYLDAEFTKPFLFTSAIIKDVKLYAKMVEPRTVTFNSNGGSAVESVEVAKGTPVARPDDPTKDGGFMFEGWYSDEGLNTPYNFDDEVTDNITLHAKWVSVKTVTLNYGYKNSVAKEVVVATGAKMASPVAGRPGYYLDGWYTAAEGGDKIDFSAYTVNDDDTLYARWTEPKHSFVLTSTVTEAYKEGSSNYSPDYFQFRWRDQYFKNGGKIAKGDVFTFMVKFSPIEGSHAPDKMILMDKDSHEFYNGPIGEAADDGWISVSVTSEKALSAVGLKMRLVYSNGKIAKGDKLEIKAVAINGEALAMDGDNTYNGIYEGCRPDLRVNPLASVVYKLTSGMAANDESGVGERFQIRWKRYTVKADDVISFKYKADEDNITKFSVRGEVDWAKAVDIPETVTKGEDDYYLFSYTIPSGQSSYFYIALYDFGNTVDNVLRIKDIEVNGEKFGITKENIYGGCSPTLVEE